MVGHVMATVCCIMALAGSSIPTQAPDPCSATYILDSTAITLTNCRSEVEAAPGSSSKRVTVALKGMTAYGDVTGDGKTDSAVILVDQPGGTGSFYYLALLPGPAMDHSTGLDVVLLGDRIVVEKNTIEAGEITVEYLDRDVGEPMTAPPRVRVTKRFIVKAGRLVPKS